MKGLSSKLPLCGVLARSIALLFINSGVIAPEHKYMAKDASTRLKPVFALALAYLRQSRAPIEKWLLFVLVGIYVGTAYAVLIGGAALLISSAAQL